MKDSFGLGALIGGLGTAMIMSLILLECAEKNLVKKFTVIEHGCAEYNRTTGEWQWKSKDDMKEYFFPSAIPEAPDTTDYRNN